MDLLAECAENAIKAGASPGELRSTLRQLVMYVAQDSMQHSLSAKQDLTL